MKPDAELNVDWLTWPAAAQLVGCPTTTIETYVRTGRIERRSDGRRPSLRRSSVEAFAVWWREEDSRREARRTRIEERRIQPPEPDGWISATEAAQRLGFNYSDQVVYLARQGRFEARKVSVRWWVRADEIDAYARERDNWLSWAAAAEMVGCTTETIRRAVRAGRIERRDVHGRASLSRRSVETFKAAWTSSSG